MNGKSPISTSSPLPQDSERNLEHRTLKGSDVKSGEMNTKTRFLTHRGGVLIVERSLSWKHSEGFHFRKKHKMHNLIFGFWSQNRERFANQILCILKLNRFTYFSQHIQFGILKFALTQVSSSFLPYALSAQIVCLPRFSLPSNPLYGIILPTKGTVEWYLL